MRRVSAFGNDAPTGACTRPEDVATLHIVFTRLSLPRSLCLFLLLLSIIVKVQCPPAASSIYTTVNVAHSPIAPAHLVFPRLIPFVPRRACFTHPSCPLQAAYTELNLTVAPRRTLPLPLLTAMESGDWLQFVSTPMEGVDSAASSPEPEKPVAEKTQAQLPTALQPNRALLTPPVSPLASSSVLLRQ